MFIVWKVCDFVGKVEISCLRGVGGSPQKVLILVQRPQHKSTSDSVGGSKKNNFGAIFIEFGDTQKCHTFGGLELVPQRELAVSAACTKVKHAFKPFGTIRKKFLFFENYNECAICAILTEKTPFWGIPKG